VYSSLYSKMQTKILSKVNLFVVAIIIILLPMQVSAADTVTMESVDMPSGAIQSAEAQSSVSPSDETNKTSVTPQPWFYGGTVGLSFGDVEYYELSPMIGRNLNPKTALGVSFMYRYRKDKRYNEDISTSDYGATLFARFSVTPLFYLQAEYEYLDYEYAILNGRGEVTDTVRDDFTSLLAGAGVRSPLGNNASMYITALYNFNYDDENSPYTDPVSIRLGVGVGY